MAWQLFGFSNGTLIQDSSSTSSSGTLVQGWSFHRVPGTEDFINFRLPADYPIVPESLTLEINGLIQSPEDYQVQPDNLSFVWLDSASPLDPSFDIRVSFAT